jgi:hypothetical protein
LPSNLIINTTSVVGYNNKLLKVSSGMSFGVNNINNETKTVKTKNPMTPSKVLPQPLPHEIPKTETPKKKINSSKQPLVSTTIHENKLATITIAVTGVAWYIFR